MDKFVPLLPMEGQEEYVKSIRDNSITLCTGYAGTGKTILALSEGLRLLNDKKSGFEKIIVIRPYMPSNTGEKLGALPGDLKEKVTPFALSVRDNLEKILHRKQDIEDSMRKIEFTVLSMCRGRSFNNCFIIVEEAQNVPCSGKAMEMLLTRVGKNCKMVIAGDLDQCDIDTRDSALIEALNVLDGINNIGIVEMENIETIQRSGIVKEIIRAYKRHYKENG